MASPNGDAAPRTRNQGPTDLCLTASHGYSDRMNEGQAPAMAGLAGGRRDLFALFLEGEAPEAVAGEPNREVAPIGCCSLDLYWLPVGAGTSRPQQWSLRLWEAIEAARARRPRAKLLHCALKFTTASRGPLTLELTPAFIKSAIPPVATGPVGVRGAERFAIFRYALRCVPGATLPDEEWAIDSPIRLSEDCASIERVLMLAREVPRYVWGRRAPGTTEMWTSDSVISWLLVCAGIGLSGVAPPIGGRAPGWLAGIAAGEAFTGRNPVGRSM